MKTFIAIIIILLIAKIISTAMPVDDSDISRHKRSGFRVHTDALTGVQYISVFMGGITPRLNKDGTLHYDKE